VRVPLDYYRILGLPIQATPEQLHQAYRDRALQRPRRDYSEVAISARKQLLDLAFQTLSSPEQRRFYNSTFLAKPYDLAPDQTSSNVILGRERPLTEAHAPSIDIDPPQLIGALLILHELGEYELVLKLGYPSIRSTIVSSTERSPRDVIQRADLVLTIALAYLELGREQWQQMQYENAASSLEHGQVLLQQENSFVNVRDEIQSDIYRLRPYQILELLSLPSSQRQHRQKGLQLIQSMLKERGGIEGKGNDHSGLNTDDFIRFIHQIRDYLSTEEQQILFESESRRPSPVAAYLAACALLSKGFTQRQPRFIVQARQFLTRLGTRQDMYLELSICALLLGQTEEVDQSLQLSQDEGPLAFIREHSHNSPDLLPGLCLYTERWLQDEIFPHFADLVNHRASLKDYFADSQVQAYLDALPSLRTPLETGFTPSVAPIQSNSGLMVVRESEPTITRPFPHDSFPISTSPAPRQTKDGFASPQSVMLSTGGKQTEILPVTSAVRVSQSQTLTPRNRKPNPTPHPRPRLVPKRPVGDHQSNPPTSPSKPVRKPHLKPLRIHLLAVITMATFMMGGIIYGLGAWLWGKWTTPSMAGNQLNIRLNQPVLELPPMNGNSPESPTPVTPVQITLKSAKQLLESWLRAKSAAFGENYAITQLNQVLTEPILSVWKKMAEGDRFAKRYRQYTHNARIIAATMDPQDAKLATMEAEVTEFTQYYENGQRLEQTKDTLQIRYFLIRQNEQWLIKGSEILKESLP
jgi:curved DNA-binding protein CbpA